LEGAFVVQSGIHSKHQIQLTFLDTLFLPTLLLYNVLNIAAIAESN
jgi:hypothetical protein